MSLRLPSRKVTLAISVIGALLVIAAATYIDRRPTASTSRPTPTPGTPTPLPAAAANEFDPKTDTDYAQRTTPPTQPPSEPTTAPAAAPPQKPIITSVDGADTASATTVTVDALAPDSTTGTCVATFARDNRVQSAPRPVTLVTSYYACSTMSVPKSALSDGSWSLTVTLTANNNSSTSASQDIIIRK